MTTWTPQRTGTVVHGRYEIAQRIGQGGFGATYKVLDRECFGQTRALKELFATEASTDAARLRFEREARVLHTLSHPALPKLHAYFVWNGSFYLVQDFIEGRTLHQVVEDEGLLDEMAVRDVVLDLLDILAYLHGRTPPVVHRDIKPDNVIRGKDGRLYLIDFGAVRAAIGPSVDDAHHTVIYTRGFAPAEQLQGHIVPASDLYAVGATAYWLLTGSTYQPMSDQTTGETFLGGVFVTPAFRSVLARLLAPLPARFASAAEARRALLDGATNVATTVATTVDTNVDSLSDSVRPGGSRPPLPPTIPAPPHPTTHAPTHAPTPARVARTPLLWGGGSVIAVAVLTATWMTFGDAHGDSPSSVPIAEASAALVESSAAVAPGFRLTIRHPASWLPARDLGDRMLAVRHTATGALFVAGLDEWRGRSEATPGEFVDRWQATTGRRFGQIDVGAAERPSDTNWQYPLTIVPPSGARQSGLLLVTRQADASATRFRWWAVLGLDDRIRTDVETMANSLEVVGQ